MFLLYLFAMSSVFFNDVLVTISIAGSLLLLLGSFPKSPFRWLVGLAEWNIAPLIFGSVFQICLFLTGYASEYPTIGFVLPMSQGLVTVLFALSFALLGGRWWLLRKYVNESHGDQIRMR